MGTAHPPASRDLIHYSSAWDRLAVLMIAIRDGSAVRRSRRPRPRLRPAGATCAACEAEMDHMLAWRRRLGLSDDGERRLARAMAMRFTPDDEWDFAEAVASGTRFWRWCDAAASPGYGPRTLAIARSRRGALN